MCIHVYAFPYNVLVTPAITKKQNIYCIHGLLILIVTMYMTLTYTRSGNDLHAWVLPESTVYSLRRRNVQRTYTFPLQDVTYIVVGKQQHKQ